MKETIRDNKEELIKRLNKIEGQVRGINKMVESNRYCIDIINQVSAVQSALDSFNKILLSDHIHHCVVNDLQQGNQESVDELCKTITRLIK